MYSLHLKPSICGLLLLLLLILTVRGQSDCHEHIIIEPWLGSQLIRYNSHPCTTLLWYPFCEDSGWGDEEANVVCRELGFSSGTSGMSTTFQGAQGYSSIECEGTENKLVECEIEDVNFLKYCSLVGVVDCYDVPQVYIPGDMVNSQSINEDPVKLCVAIRGEVDVDVDILVETRSNGSALANFDYIPVNQTLKFGPSHSSMQCLVIEVINDSLTEGLEQFIVELSTTSSAVKIIDGIFSIFIQENDFESSSCTEGSVSLVSDVNNSSLQLVEMCSIEGVWSPVCDTSWTIQDATIVCRELGQNDGSVAEAVIPESFMGSNFPECLGNETRLAACPTTSDGTITSCNPVLVDCDVQSNDNEDKSTDHPFDVWMVVSSIIVAIMVILILVIIIGLASIVYSKWRAASVQSAKAQTESSPEVTTASNDTHSNGATLAKIQSPINRNTSVFTNSGLHNFDNPLYAETALMNTTITDDQTQPSSDSPEHNLINPLYAEPEQSLSSPPLSQTILTGLNTVDDRVSVDLTTIEPHYETPHTPKTITTDNDAIRFHRYEYIKTTTT